MGHEITNSDKMAFCGEVPWHGLGVQMPGPMDSATAMEAAGLDWRVLKRKVVAVAEVLDNEGEEEDDDDFGFDDDDDEDSAVDDGRLTLRLGADERVSDPDDIAYVTVRSDTGTLLGMVGRLYRPVQNYEAFAFMDGVAQHAEEEEEEKEEAGIEPSIESSIEPSSATACDIDDIMDGFGGAIELAALAAPAGILYHTAGSLKGGKTVWMLAKLIGQRVSLFNGRDLTECYLLLVNNHDGRGSLRCFFTTVRVVCNNTLQMALNSKGGINIRHTGTIMGRVAEAQRVLGLAGKVVAAHQELAESFAACRLSLDEWRAVRDLLVPLPLGGNQTKGENDRDALDGLYAGYTPDGETMPGGAVDLPETAGTAWAALQAVTSWSTHFKTVRGGAEARLGSKWFGSADQLDQFAVKLLKDIFEGGAACEAVLLAAEAQRVREAQAAEARAAAKDK